MVSWGETKAPEVALCFPLAHKVIAFFERLKFFLIRKSVLRPLSLVHQKKIANISALGSLYSAAHQIAFEGFHVAVLSVK